MTLEALLKHPALWKGHQQNDSRETLATGHAKLDAALPANGWPVGALTELMVAHEGVGEFMLLLPALAALTQQQQWIALVAPPYIPYAPALLSAGVSLDRMLLVNPDAGSEEPGQPSLSRKDSQKNASWATEQLLRSGVFSAVVMWANSSGDERQQRRLQLAAEAGKAWGVCYRPCNAARNASPAGLRMVLQQNPNGLEIDIIKNRGGRLRTLTLPPLHEPDDQATVADDVISDNLVSLARPPENSHENRTPMP